MSLFKKTDFLLLCVQVIHNLSMWTARDKSLTFDQLKAEAGKAQKDQHLVILLYQLSFLILYSIEVVLSDAISD